MRSRSRRLRAAVLLCTLVGANNISAYAIAANGALSAVAGSPFPAGTGPDAISITPDGTRLYVGNNGSNNLSAYTIAASGSLTPILGSPFLSGGNGPKFQALAITPNQPPVASFTVGTASNGEPLAFDASASTDPDGSVASYVWDFGDASSTTVTSPQTTHTYASPGTTPPP